MRVLAAGWGVYEAVMTTQFRHPLSSALTSLLVSVSPAYSAGNPIVEFNGNGSINTGPFETTGPREI
jgi:hypothetical protein